MPLSGVDEAVNRHGVTGSDLVVDWGKKPGTWQQRRGSESAAASLTFRVFPAEKSARQQVRGKAILLPGHDFEELSSSESGLI